MVKRKDRGLDVEGAALPTSARKRVRPLPSDQSTAVASSSTASNNTRNSVYERPGVIATKEAAAVVDARPPLAQLEKILEEQRTMLTSTGSAVVYWMRMQDLRIKDNGAFAAASAYAKKEKVPLLVLFIFSPGDYKAHDRSPRRIDFTIRNLKCLKRSLDEMDIPLYVLVQRPRSTIPQKVISLATEWNVTHIFSNFEYEVDELRRDMSVLDLGARVGVQFSLVHDSCVIDPGLVTTKELAPYSVYGHWLKKWSLLVTSNIPYLNDAPFPASNDPSIRQHETYGRFFDIPIPDFIEGFECEDRIRMEELWPAGEEVAAEVLARFIQTKARSSQIGDASPISPGAESVPLNSSRIGVYKDERDRCDKDTSSRISPYLSAGVISARECLRSVIKAQGKTKAHAVRDNGPGVWMMEVAWRDFYTHILAAFPRVSMGRPFHEKYANIFWEEDSDGKYLDAWKQGKTGYPIVDAAMRQCNTQGWMHNRVRMIAAMFLSKDLMLDWRLGERYFMQNFIDGDLASNNGGWQWSASTGTDSQPYFRIFNPYLQSEKADPTGDFIRHFVPELSKLRGKAVHDPFHNLPREVFDKLGYPKPIVDHATARDRALRRFKNVGSA